MREDIKDNGRENRKGREKIDSLKEEERERGRTNEQKKKEV